MDLVEEYWMDPSSEDYSEHVVTMTHFDDPNQPYTCTQWARMAYRGGIGSLEFDYLKSCLMWHLVHIFRKG